MPFPATSETCYVAPPTSVPTFPPPPSLSLAAFSRPFTSLLECFFFFRRVLFTDSKASQHAVTSTWTRRPLLPRLLPTPRSSHQSLPSPRRAVAARRLLQILLVAKTSPCSTFGASLLVLTQAVLLEAWVIRMSRAELAPGVEGGRQRTGFSPCSGKPAGRSIMISVDVTHNRAA